MVHRDNSLPERLRNLGAAVLMLPLGPITAGIVAHDNHNARKQHSDQALPTWQAYALDPLKMLLVCWGLFVVCTPLCLLQLPFAPEGE